MRIKVRYFSCVSVASVCQFRRYCSMKLFTKQRLQIKKKPSSTRIQWWRVSFFDVILLVWIPLMIIWGVASANGAEEVIGISVLQMNPMATLIYWGVLALLLSHMAFNRRVILLVDKKKLVYRKRFFPPKRIKLNVKQISSITIDEWEDPIAETPAAGQSIIDFRVVIKVRDHKTVTVKGFGESDAETIKKIIESYR